MQLTPCNLASLRRFFQGLGFGSRKFGPVVLITIGCSVLNEKEVCEGVAPQESIVNQQQDGNELLLHPQSLAEIDDGNLMLVFDGQSIERLPMGMPRLTSVRLSRFDRSSGAQRIVCTGSLLDRNVSDSAAYAHAGSITAADVDVGGTRAVALVAWTQDAYPDSTIRMRFVDVAGCPLGPGSFDPLGGPARSVSVAWSARRQAALAVVDDGTSLTGLWISAPGIAERVPIVDGRRITSIPVLSVAPDGGIFLAWSELDRGARFVLLDGNGVPLGPDTDSGVPALHYPDGKGNISVALAASAGRLAIVADAALAAEVDAVPAVYVREFDRRGQPLGSAWRVDDSPVRQLSPTAAYLPAGSLLVAWESETGTTARLFRDDGEARFSSIACDESSFSVGVQNPQLSLSPVPASVGEEAWIFHTAPDPRGVGVWLWRMPFAKLWPGKN